VRGLFPALQSRPPFPAYPMKMRRVGQVGIAGQIIFRPAEVGLTFRSAASDGADLKVGATISSMADSHHRTMRHPQPAEVGLTFRSAASDGADLKVGATISSMADSHHRTMRHPQRAEVGLTFRSAGSDRGCAEGRRDNLLDGRQPSQNHARPAARRSRADLQVSRF